LAGDSPLKRNRGEAGDFAVSSLFNGLAALLFRIGENAARRAGDGSSAGADGGRRAAGGNGHGGISDGQRTFYQNSDIQKAIVCSRYDRPSLSTARKWASGQADAALFSRCRAVAFGAVDPTHGSAKRRPRNGATLSAERGVCSRRRRGILTLAYCHCIVSLHRFTEAADGQNR
jgi:hypothetical protein